MTKPRKTLAAIEQEVSLTKHLYLTLLLSEEEERAHQTAQPQATEAVAVAVPEESKDDVAAIEEMEKTRQGSDERRDLEYIIVEMNELDLAAQDQ